MYCQNEEQNIKEIQRLFKAIEKVFRKMSRKNTLLLTSVTLNNQIPMPELAQRMLYNIFIIPKRLIIANCKFLYNAQMFRRV
jgi:hypothetical protein